MGHLRGPAFILLVASITLFTACGTGFQQNASTKSRAQTTNTATPTPTSVPAPAAPERRLTHGYGWDYASFLGGSKVDAISAMARDSAGSVYLVGYTESSDFPVTSGALQTKYTGIDGAGMGFVAKFSSHGNLIWASYLGPSTYSRISLDDVAVDSEGAVYVAGTGWSNFPETPPATTLPIRPSNGFVLRIAPGGDAIEYARVVAYPGDRVSSLHIILDDARQLYVLMNGCCFANDSSWGASIERLTSDGQHSGWQLGWRSSEANDFARDSKGNLYVTGGSSQFPPPCTAGAYCNGWDNYVIKIDPSRPAPESIVYTARLGNSNVDLFPQHSGMGGETIAVDAEGNAYVGTTTNITNMPTSPAAFQQHSVSPENQSLVWDTYIAKLDPSGSKIMGGTYLSGTGPQYIRKIAVDSAGNVYAVGFTASSDFLTTAFTKSVPEGAWYVKLHPDFSAASSVRFGGKRDWVSLSKISLDDQGGLWAAGSYSSPFTGDSPDPTAFPTTKNAQQSQIHGAGDGILLHTAFPPFCGDARASLSLCAPVQRDDSNGRVEISAQANGSVPVNQMAVEIDGLSVSTSNSEQLDELLPVAPGWHVLTITATDSHGSVRKRALPFLVPRTEACPVNPVTPSLTICSPLNAASHHTRFTLNVTAKGYDAPKDLDVFVDGVQTTSIPLLDFTRKTLPDGTADGTGTYSANLNLHSGVHRITVQGFSGSVFVKTSTIFRTK